MSEEAELVASWRGGLAHYLKDLLRLLPLSESSLVGCSHIGPIVGLIGQLCPFSGASPAKHRELGVGARRRLSSSLRLRCQEVAQTTCCRCPILRCQEQYLQALQITWGYSKFTTRSKDWGLGKPKASAKEEFKCKIMLIYLYTIYYIKEFK